MATPISDAIASLPTTAEKSAYKASAYAGLPNAVWSATVGTSPVYTVRFSVVPVANAALLQFSIKVTKPSGNINPPINVTPAGINPVSVYNPPILVPDPAGDVVRTWTNPDGTTGSATFREDLPAALTRMILDLLAQRGIP